MEFLTFIIVAIFVSIAVYIAIDTPTSFLHERLRKHTVVEGKDEINDRYREKQMLDSISVLLRPLIQKILNKNDRKKTLRQLLLEAGRSSSDEDAVGIVVNQILYALLGLIFGIIFCFLSNFDTTVLFIFVLVPVLLYRLPLMSVKNSIKYRQTEIIYNLPDALDLLTVCVEAGLSVDASFARVSKEFSRTSDILAGEFERVSKDILSGLTRQEAFKNLALRNGVEDIHTLVALLVQTEKLGTSISQSLRTYSDTMRTRRRQRAEGLAQQASVKMVIPLVFFVMPALFVVILGPAVISLMSGFGNTK